MWFPSGVHTTIDVNGSIRVPQTLYASCIIFFKHRMYKFPIAQFSYLYSACICTAELK